MQKKNKLKVLITGGSGYIAKSLYNAFKNQYDITSITRQNFDLTAFQAMNDFFQNKYFDVVIHCAAQGGSRLKPDSCKDMDVNLAMYYNLLQHKPHYAKLIYFGSGAEIHNPESFYGLSKGVIAKSILENDNFYNIRIFGVFDENEWETRYIKSNIKRYINKEPMLAQNKLMDFFYMEDLITLVLHHIEECPTKLIKESNCSYVNTLSLINIAHIINELDEHTVPVYVDTAEVSDYVSSLHAPYNLKYVGLEEGIKRTYQKLKQ